MKGELEEHVKELGFKNVVILRPGLLVGGREKSRLGEGQMQGIARGLRGVFGNKATNFWAQDADVVAKAAVRAGWKCAKGEREEGVWEIGQGEIVTLGSPEWKSEEEGKA